MLARGPQKKYSREQFARACCRPVRAQQCTCACICTRGTRAFVAAACATKGRKQVSSSLYITFMEGYAYEEKETCQPHMLT